MKLFKLFPTLLLGTLALTSCEDFLDKGSKDGLEVDQYLTSDDNLKSFTYQLYGPFAWEGFDSKFSWCANELAVGNIYHNYGDEGQFFFLNFTNTNANLLNGYQSLYGVIGRCNMIINRMPEIARANGCSEAAINRAIGEAYMFRGMCYFLLTEYFGETYIVTNNEADITNDVSFNIQKSDRACLYTQAEQDFLKAANLLPDSRWGNNGERAYKASAFGMLAKLYLTMASACGSYNAEHPFTVPAGESMAGYFQKASDYADWAINMCGGVDGALSSDYENFFWPRTYDKELLFSLHFEDGAYGAGSQRQVMFSRSKYIGADIAAYGGEKGLTRSLFETYEAGDIRKKATSYYTDADQDKSSTASYKLFDGSEYIYYANPNVSFEGKEPYGNEPDGPVLNHCRKFVYCTPVQNEFSCPLSIAFLRVTDLFLIKAEAQMAITDAPGVTDESSNGDALKYVNKVRNERGLGDKTSIALIKNAIPFTDKLECSKEIEGVEYKYTAEVETHKDQYSLFQERRHEFALENQNWLDLKRIYYRDPVTAQAFLANQDRGYVYGVKYGVDAAMGVSDYARQALNYKASQYYHEIDPTIKLETPETAIDVNNVAWFFPLPSKVVGRGASGIYTDVESIKNGTYPY